MEQSSNLEARCKVPAATLPGINPTGFFVVAVPHRECGPRPIMVGWPFVTVIADKATIGCPCKLFWTSIRAC